VVGRPGLDPGTSGLNLPLMSTQYDAFCRTRPQNCRHKPNGGRGSVTSGTEVRSGATPLLGTAAGGNYPGAVIEPVTHRAEAGIPSFVQPAVRPPSTQKTAPVTLRASSDRR
jgi:hypothetical protein